MGPEQMGNQQWKAMAEQILGKDFFDTFYSSMSREEPSYNVYQNSSEIVVLINLPYIHDLRQLKLNVAEQELYVQGNIDLGYEHMEKVSEGIFSGSFELTIHLPQAVNAKKVNAQYKKGILIVQLYPNLRKKGHQVSIMNE